MQAPGKFVDPGRSPISARTARGQPPRARRTMASLPPLRRTTHEPTMMAMSMPNPILEGADEAKNEHGADDDETKMKRVRAYAFSESPFRRISTAAAFVWIWAKLCRRVRAAQKRVAEQFGNALCAFSLCDAVVQTLLMFAMGEDAVPSLVLDYAVFPPSAAAVVTHFSSRLPYERVTSFWFHVGSFVLRAFARGAHRRACTTGSAGRTTGSLDGRRSSRAPRSRCTGCAGSSSRPRAQRSARAPRASGWSAR